MKNVFFISLQEHLNFICDDGPIILSVKQEVEKLDGCDTQGFIKVILRYCKGIHMIITKIKSKNNNLVRELTLKDTYCASNGN